MNSFKPLGERSASEIIEKLKDIDDDDESDQLIKTDRHLESLFPTKAWLNTQHQYGFIPKISKTLKRLQDIQSTSRIKADHDLINSRINIRLDYLRIYDYPKTIFSHIGDNIHTILFSFEAKNQTTEGSETAVFNQTYPAKSGQDAAVQGWPIFIGLNVGQNGLSFSCKTVNIGNTGDQEILQAINSEGAEKGLQLLTVAQPALGPLVEVARGICNVLAERSKNVAVQQFTLGLDFDDGSTGSRLALGSYIVAQVSRADEINWSDWKYDNDTGAIVRNNLAPNEESYVLPFNTVVFRVSKYQG